MKKPTKPNYDDKPYTPSVATDVLALFKRLGWVPPSEQKHIKISGRTIGHLLFELLTRGDNYEPQRHAGYT